MRVIALGGTGAMGRAAVACMRDLGVADEIVTADKSATADVTVDASDAGALADLLSGADIVVNTVGPFYRYAVPILRAAIDAGCDYIDICDDWEPTLEMLDLDSDARDAGVRCVVGLGASPGISNMLAAKAIRALDEVEEVITGWSLEDDLADAELRQTPRRGDAGVSAAIEHWLHQCSGTIRVRRDGNWVDERPLDRFELHLPDRGRMSGWSVGHPEPVTIPLSEPSVRFSVNVMIGDSTLIPVLKLYRWRIDHGLPVDKAARSFTKWINRLIALDRRTRRRTPHHKSVAQRRVPPLLAIAKGRRASREFTAIATPKTTVSGAMAGATGVPAAVGVKLLVDGLIERKGVYAPESGVDPDAFFAALAPLCSPPGAGVDDVVAVTIAGHHDV